MTDEELIAHLRSQAHLTQTDGLLALLETGKQAADRIAALDAENARLRKLAAPEWFYLAGDTSSECCRSSPSEVIDEDWLWNNRAEGSAVVQIETAARCADIWCAVRFSTDEEKDRCQYEITEHATEAEARAALGEPGND